MKRVASKVALLLELLCLAATFFFGIRSYYWHDAISLKTGPSQQSSLVTSPGFIYLWRRDAVNDFGETIPMWYTLPLIEKSSQSQKGPASPFGRPHREPSVAFLGFGLYHAVYTSFGPSQNVGGPGIRIPFWFPVALFAAFITFHVKRRLTHYRRLREGHCLHCGYDLRGTPEGCPECGLIAPSALMEDRKPSEKKISADVPFSC